MNYKNIYIALIILLATVYCNPLSSSGEGHQVTKQDILGSWYDIVDGKPVINFINNNDAILTTNDGVGIPAKYTLIKNEITLYIQVFDDVKKIVIPIKDYGVNLMKCYVIESKEIVTLKRIK